MNVPGPPTLGLSFLISEVALSLAKRSRGDGRREDRSTLRVLWLVITVAIIGSVLASRYFPAANLGLGMPLRLLALVIFLVGLALRWWAIIVLGRFFTVDVQILKDHKLVEAGPFRYVRHPSYTGVLLAFLGFGLSLANWLSLLVLLLPIFLAFCFRMQVEEEALTTALGDEYRSYLARTKRLIPGVY